MYLLLQLFLKRRLFCCFSSTTIIKSAQSSYDTNGIERKKEKKQQSAIEAIEQRDTGKKQHKIGEHEEMDLQI